MSETGLLLLAFGGPTPGCCGRRATCSKAPGYEAECFVSGVLGDQPGKAHRIATITAHYHQLGGFSPFNDLTLRQVSALRGELARRGRALPVACGFRHWPPWIGAALAELAAAGCRRVVPVVLSPFPTRSVGDAYLNAAAQTMEQVANAPELAAPAAPFWNRPGFVTALADRVHATVADWPAERFAAAGLVFTAHAIPKRAEKTSPYRPAFAETARQVAAAMGHPDHLLAFQSQPDDGGAWSEPTIKQVIEDAHRAGKRELVVQAVGFLVDHVEVLYDLDHEAAALAAGLGLGFHRAPCVGDHPAFIGTLADLVEEAIG